MYNWVVQTVLFHKQHFKLVSVFPIISSDSPNCTEIQQMTNPAWFVLHTESKAATFFANETTLVVCLALLACWLSAADALAEVCIECLAFESKSDITAGEPLSLPASFRSSLLLLMHHYSPCQHSCTGSNGSGGVNREKGETNREQSRTISTNVAWSLIQLTEEKKKKKRRRAIECLMMKLTKTIHIIILIMYTIFYTQTMSPMCHISCRN